VGEVVKKDLRDVCQVKAVGCSKARQNSWIVVLGLDVEEGGVLNGQIGWIRPVLCVVEWTKRYTLPSSYPLVQYLAAVEAAQALPRGTCESNGKSVVPVLRDKNPPK